MASSQSSRNQPNILVVGTPGTGKSLTCAEVATKTGFEHIKVGTLAKENSLYEGYDEILQCPIIDEDGVSPPVDQHLTKCLISVMHVQ